MMDYKINSLRKLRRHKYAVQLPPVQGKKRLLASKETKNKYAQDER